MKVTDFKKGDWVYYVPSHIDRGKTLQLDTNPEIERGIVCSHNDIFVFVNFGNTGTSPACNPDDLVKYQP